MNKLNCTASDLKSIAVEPGFFFKTVKFNDKLSANLQIIFILDRIAITLKCKEPHKPSIIINLQSCYKSQNSKFKRQKIKQR